ncbi:prepilin peptidase [Candidatus Gracilibacteria bacterium]|nr:prepilin peptidase [Candidatus Gracilibacteria bacterium]
MTILIVLTIAAGILGMLFGSFISVAIDRLHTKEKGMVTGRSRCEACKKTLHAKDLVPLLSFLVLRGKCRHCSARISYMYPILELITGALFALMYVKFPFLTESLVFSESMMGLFVLHAFYTIVLVFTFFYDLRYMEVADEVLVPGIIIALIATIGAPLTPSLIDALLGMAIPVGFFLLQILVSKGRWIGGGDLRVGAFMGAILGWQLVIVALFASYMVGSIISIGIALKKKTLTGIQVPFAPFLVAGTYIAMFFGNDLIKWYLGSL